MNQPTKLFNRNYLTLWTAQFVSRMGYQAFLIALLFWVKNATGSATLMGTIALVSGLPAVILGPIGGTLADRFSRRKIIILSDVLRGLGVLTLAALVYLLPDATGLILVWLFVVSVASGVIGSIFGPAITAAIPDLVPKDRVPGANSMGQVSAQVSAVLGPALGGVLYSLLGAPLLLLFNAITYLFAAGVETSVHIPQNIPKRDGNLRKQLSQFKDELIEGMRYIWRRPGLRELVVVSAILAFFTAPLAILLTFYVEDTLGVSEAWYGFLLSGYGVGALVGYLGAGVLRVPSRTRGIVTAVFIVAQGLAYGLLGVATSAPAALALMVASGIMDGFVLVHITTIMQVSTPGDIRGRVFGLLAAISGSLSPIALGLAGIVTDLVNQNVGLIFMASGLMMVIVCILLLFDKRVRELLSYNYDVEEVAEYEAADELKFTV